MTHSEIGVAVEIRAVSDKFGIGMTPDGFLLLVELEDGKAVEIVKVSLLDFANAAETFANLVAKAGRLQTMEVPGKPN